MAVHHLAEGFHTVTPFIVAQDTAKLVDFIERAFGAEEVSRMAAPDGTVYHAELRLGDSMIMLGEAGGEWKPMPATLYVYVKDVDATFARAVGAGAVSVKDVADQFYGDRNGTVRDAWGNLWSIATHIEDVSPDEMERRAKAAMQQPG